MKMNIKVMKENFEKMKEVMKEKLHSATDELVCARCQGFRDRASHGRDHHIVILRRSSSLLGVFMRPRVPKSRFNGVGGGVRSGCDAAPRVDFPRSVDLRGRSRSYG